jgi:oxygen-dependent protoporphyrinogen oxidase
MRVAVIGAGIGGLSAAFELQREHAGQAVEVHVFEAAAQAGGTMRTQAIEGFLFEAGGNGFLTNKPDSVQLVKDAGAEALLLPSSDAARKRYLFTDQLHPLPESPAAFLRSPLLPLSAKLRVAAEVLVPKRTAPGEESLQAFGYRRVGKAFTDTFLDAMTAGIYATTPDKVSVQAAFPLVANLEQEYGGLFRGMLARRKRQAGPGGILMSFRGGVGSFIAHLQATIQAVWHWQEPVVAITAHHCGEKQARFRLRTAMGESLFDQVVIATQAHAAAAMLQSLNPSLAGRLRAIEYSPVAVVGFGWRHLEHPLDGFGLLTTTAAQLPILGVLWDSSIFTDRAPAGGKSVRVMLGGQRNPEQVQQTEAGLIATAQEGIRRTMGVTQPPDVTFVQRWERGIPSYRVGHRAAVERILDDLHYHPGLYLAGNAYQGIAMNDCVRNGRAIARTILQTG